MIVPLGAGAPATAIESEPGWSEGEKKTRITLPFSHSVDLLAAAVAGERMDEPAAAYRFENSDIVGEYSVASGQSVAEFLQEFQERFGTQPEVTGVIVERPIETGGKESRQGTAPIDPGAPAFDAPPVKLSAEYEQVGTPPAATESVSRAVADWRPTDAEFELRNQDGRANFLHSYWWYNDSTPQMMPTGFGAEFEVNIYNDASEVLGRPACPAGYKEAFWAKNYDWNWSVLRPDYQGANLASLGAYADYNDLSDPCNKNSIAIGLRYVKNIPKVNSTYGIIIWVSAPKGTKSSSRIGGLVQAVSDSFCTSIIGSSMALTDCMGAYAGTWNSSAPQFRRTANEKRGWTAPTICWTSGGKGEIDAKVEALC